MPKSKLTLLGSYRIYLSIVLTFASMSSFAGGLEEDLAKAYTKSPTFKIIQQEFMSSIDRAINDATSNLMPQIEGRITADQNSNRMFNRQDYTSVRTGIRKELVIEQPLFSSGTSAADLKMAQASAIAAKHDFYIKEQEAISKAIEYYLAYQASKDIYNHYRSMVTSRTHQFNGVKERFAAGYSTKTELATAEANLSRITYEAFNNYVVLQKASGNFKNMFFFDPEDSTYWPNLDNLKLADSLEQFREIVLANNFELHKSKYELISAKAGHSSSLASLGPKLSLSANISQTQNDTQFSENYVMDKRVGLTLRMPLFQRGQEYTKIRLTNRNARIANYRLTLNEQIIENMIKVNWEADNAARQSLISAQKTVESATMAVKSATKAYSLGEGSLMELLKLEDELSIAQTRAIETKQAYLKQFYGIKAFMGQLTANVLGLPVKFNPAKEIKKRKLFINLK